MTDFDILMRGNLLNSSIEEKKNKLLEVYNKAADSLREFAVQEFTRSVELNSFVGRYADPEALTAILRGIKVEVSGGWPPDLVMKFEDDLAHLYGGEELPAKLSNIIDSLFETSSKAWFDAGKFDELIFEMVDS